MSDFKEDGYKIRADMAVKTLILGKTDAGSIGRSGITPKIRRLPKMFLSILKPVVTADFPAYPLKAYRSLKEYGYTYLNMFNSDC